MERQFNAAIPIEHDCGHIHSVDVIGLTEHTTIVCPSCGSEYSLDYEVIEKIHEDFVEMLSDQLLDAGLDWDDDALLAFARMHGRLPKPGEDYSEFQ